MTRTEDRLTDALAAVARGIPEETLPPLPARSPARRRWGRWLAPLAAAASVALIVVLASAVQPFSHGTPGAEQVAGPPRYYATLELDGIFIHDTATGAVTAKIPDKTSRHGSGEQAAVGVAAADNGREFIAAYTRTEQRPHYRQKIELYSFHLTSAGHIAGLSRVRGGTITGLAGRDIAVSPDGSKVALVLYHQPDPTKPPSSAEIMVVDLRTGARGLWQGGLERSGLSLSIPSLSWRPGGTGLVFLALWCGSEVYDGGSCEPGTHYAQVRTLPLDAGGGLLSQGNALLSQSARYPDMVQALLDPGAKSVTLVELRGHGAGKAIPVPQRLQVIRVPLGGGAPRVLYQSPTGGQMDVFLGEVFLGSDASGRYLLLAGLSNGWLDHGVLRPLSPPHGPADAFFLTRAGAVVSDAW